MTSLSGSKYVFHCFREVRQKRCVPKTGGGRLPVRFSTASGGYQNRADPRSASCLQVSEPVSYQPRLSKIQSKFSRSLKQHSRHGFAALAIFRWGMWTKVESVNTAPCRSNSLDQTTVNLRHCCSRHHSSSDCRLVGDNHGRIFGLLQPCDCTKGGRENVQLLSASHIIASIFVDYPISIKKHCASRAAC